MDRAQHIALTLQARARNATDWLDRHDRLLRVALIALAVVVWSVLGAVKLARFGYNALDLAIYTQVLWNTAHGHWFAFTIHQQSYLGDHLELGLALLAPLMRLAAHPLTLIVAQATAMAAAAWPLARLVNRRIGRPAGVLLTAAFLLNPFILNTVLFEVHFLPFALLPLLVAIDAYDEQRYGRYLVGFAAALLVREDVALVLVMFSVLALIDRRSRRWVLPGLVAVAWFAGALWLAGHLNPNGQYKFLAFYGWLGGTLPEIVRTALTQPWLVLDRLISWNNLNFTLGILLPFGYLPLLKPRSLVLAAPIFLQIFLIEQLSTLVFKIHYTVLLLPALCYGFVLGLEAIFRSPRPPRWARWLSGERAMSGVIVAVVVLYSSIVIGPWLGLASERGRDDVEVERAKAAQVLIDRLGPDASVAASFATLTELATRPLTSSLHYVFLGKQQYADVAYTLPDETRFLLIDQRDLVLYHALYHEDEGDNAAGFQRLRDLITSRHFGVVASLGDFLLLERGAGIAPLLASTSSTGETAGTLVGDNLRVFDGDASRALTVDEQTIGGQTFRELALTLRASVTTPTDRNLVGELSVTRGGAALARYPVLLSPFRPTSEWVAGEVVSWGVRLLLPDADVGGATVTLTIADETSLPWLNGWGTIVPRVTSSEVLGDVTLGSLR